MAGLPEGFTIDAAAAPTGSGLPAGFTIDPPALADGYNDEDVKKSLASGLVKFGAGALGLPVAGANALNKAVSGLTGTEAPPDIQTGSSQYLLDKFQKYVAPLHTSTTAIGDKAGIIGEVAPQLMGPGGILKKLGSQVVGPAIASKTADIATEGTPYHDLAVIGAGLAAGVHGADHNITAADALPANPSVTAGGLRKAGAHPDTIAKVQMLEKAQLAAKKSGDPINQSLRDEAQGILLDDKQREMLSPETQSALQDFIDHGASTKTNTAAKGWGMGTAGALLAEGIPVVGHVVGGAVMAGSVAAKALRKLSDNRATKAFEQIKADAAAEPPPPEPTIPATPNPTGPKVGPPPTPWGPVPPEPPPAPPMPDPAQLKLQMDQLVNQRSVLAKAQATQPSGPQMPDPQQLKLQMDKLVNERQVAAANQPAPAEPVSGVPDPTQLKLQMDKLVNERRVLARAQAANQPPPPPVVPPAPPEINPLALPTSITTPAKNIMGGAANAQSMKAKSDPLSKYEDAVRMNAGLDRANTSALTKDATGLMAARKAAAAIEETNAEPSAPATTPGPPPMAAPVATPPVIAKLSKKSGGKLKETPAPASEPPPAAPVAPEAAPELPQSDYSHLPRAAAAKLITDRVFAAGKKIAVTPEEYQQGVMEKLTAKEHIADDMAKAMPEVEHQDINAHLQGAKTKAGAAEVMEHYIKLHPEAEAAIRLAMAKKRLNAGWTR